MPRIVPSSSFKAHDTWGMHFIDPVLDMRKVSDIYNKQLLVKNYR